MPADAESGELLARAPIDLGATLRAVGQRSADPAPLFEGLALAARCGSEALERRAERARRDRRAAAQHRPLQG